MNQPNIINCFRYKWTSTEYLYITAEIKKEIHHPSKAQFIRPEEKCVDVPSLHCFLRGTAPLYNVKGDPTSEGKLIRSRKIITEWCGEERKKKLNNPDGHIMDMENLRWLAPSPIRRWWRLDGIRRNGWVPGWDGSIRSAAAVGPTPANFKNLLLLLLLAEPVEFPLRLRVGPDIWTSRKKAKCWEQHL